MWILKLVEIEDEVRILKYLLTDKIQLRVLNFASC